MYLRGLLPFLLALCVPGTLMAANPVDETIYQRTQGQEDAVLIQTLLRFEINSPDAAPKSSWVLIERTPNGRVAVLNKTDPTGPSLLTFLVQDNTNLVMAGEQVHSPAASWMWGMYLFDQPMEPITLLSWVQGIPGINYSAAREIVELRTDGKIVESIIQDGWEVSYDTWSSDGPYPTPKTFSIQKDGTRINVQVHALTLYSAVPEGYNEFSIR